MGGQRAFRESSASLPNRDGLSAPWPPLPLFRLERTHYLEGVMLGPQHSSQLQIRTPGKPSVPDKGWEESSENSRSLKQL